MRFTVAWANVISENSLLKLVLGVCLIVVLILSLLVAKLSGRRPLVVERACYSRVLQVVDSERTPSEVESFIREALSQRFDSTAVPKPDFLSPNEQKFRDQEQMEFKKREMTQRLIINQITVTSDKAAIEADRLFTVGTIRSALPFPLTLALGTIARSEWNPYGLTLLQVTAPQPGAGPSGGGK